MRDRRWMSPPLQLAAPPALQIDARSWLEVAAAGDRCAAVAGGLGRCRSACHRCRATRAAAGGRRPGTPAADPHAVACCRSPLRPLQPCCALPPLLASALAAGSRWRLLLAAALPTAAGCRAAAALCQSRRRPSRQVAVPLPLVAAHCRYRSCEQS